MMLSSNSCEATVMDGNIPSKNCTEPVTYGWNATNLSLPQKLTQAARSSRLLSSAKQSLLDAMEAGPLAFHHHGAAVDVSTFQQTPELHGSWSILSTSVDEAGKEFVSTVEGMDLPWYGVQWHPEKPA